MGSRIESTKATVNGQCIDVAAGETLLLAALRQGIAFPNSCRVGGCGTCKCRVAEGQVRELTETGYLLSGDEIDRGFVLACQSVPRGDVSIEVAMGEPPAPRTPGRIVAQHRLTHDILQLQVQLDAPLAYRAGQHARLSVDDLPGVARNYSFATPSEPEGRLEFLVRKVPGGSLSSLLNDVDLRGQPITVEGPLGEFWLRPGDAPLLMVAGGSGLAPILAMLREAAAAGCTRPVTLLFGARKPHDLYAQDEIDALAKAWRAPFHFLPVLSEAGDDAGWPGAKGWVTDQIDGLLAPGAHAYLCGPPPMIDAAQARLQRLGVQATDIHCDPFTTAADVAAARESAAEPEREPARFWDYAKYFGFHAVGLSSIVALMAGGGWITAGLLAIVSFYILGDAVSGNDLRTPRFRRPGVLTAQLWLALPLVALIVFSAVWGVSAGDPLGYGAWLTHWTGHDVIAARAATTFGHHVSAVILTGLMIGMIATITAHELMHRTWDKVSLGLGRWLMAFSFDTAFTIEHVYGHHRYVATPQDPATAPRGRNVYAHIVLSTVAGNASAWRIERDRLHKKHLPVWSAHNAVLRGYLMSLLLLALAWAMGGMVGALFFAACGLAGKALLEVVNYMEHYGIQRDPASPVQPRHSWNTNRRISSWTLFNLTRHSHHHAQGEVPFQDLKPMPDAPLMIGGYLTVMVVTLVPPLWHALMTPKLLAWDRDHADAGERGLARAANAASGIAGLQRAALAADQSSRGQLEASSVSR